MDPNWSFYDGEFIYVPAKQLAYLKEEIAKYKENLIEADESLTKYQKQDAIKDNKLHAEREVKEKHELKINKLQILNEKLLAEISKNKNINHDLKIKFNEVKAQNAVLNAQQINYKEKITELKATCSERDVAINQFQNDVRVLHKLTSIKENEYRHLKSLNNKFEADIIQTMKKLEARLSNFPNEFIRPVTINNQSPCETSMASTRSNDTDASDLPTDPKSTYLSFTTPDSTRSNQKNTNNENNIDKKNSYNYASRMNISYQQPYGTKVTSTNGDKENMSTNESSADGKVRIVGYLKKKITDLIKIAYNDQSTQNNTNIALYFNDLCYLFIKTIERLHEDNNKYLKLHTHYMDLRNQLNLKQEADFKLMKCIDEMTSRLEGKVRFHKSRKVQLLRQMAVIVHHSIVKYKLDQMRF